MGTVTLEFVGLFLFNSNANNPAEIRIAVIDADRNGVIHDGKPLTPHKASFSVTKEGDVLKTNWPRTPDGAFELAKNIAFDASGPLHVSANRWALPRIATGCRELQIDPSFFEKPAPGATHAVITVRSGELCSWRFNAPPGPSGAVNTRITIPDQESFAIIRDEDEKRIDLVVANDPIVVFTNTELEVTTDYWDWYWYYVATGQKCAPPPDDTHVIAPCPPLDRNPLSLGCSNSNWP